MNSTHLRRSLVAVTTVIACLAVMASPAAAATHNATTTGGVVTVFDPNPIVGDTYSFGPIFAYCSSDTLQLDVTTTGTVGTTAFGATSAVNYFGSTGNPYLRVVTRVAAGSTYGTLTGTGPYTITNMRVTLLVVYYPSTAWNVTTCAITGTPVCSIGFVLELDGTLTGTTPTSTASLTGTGVGTVAALPTCGPPFSVLIGGTAAVTAPITATLTT